ncbi:MAG TPA: hypothetical protein VFJ02_07375 [Vicinamibacterales bacterium]|nr:hypothetical protein [Vicinamibacterales bacterium]
MIARRTVALAAVVHTLSLSIAFAQDEPREPISRFVADAHVAFPNFPDDASIATGLGITEENLPGRGLGLAFGVHVYPARMGKVTLGLGGQLLISRASNTLEPATEGGAAGPTVKGYFNALSPEVSLNFGSGEGWSYVSGGIGWSTLTIENAARPVTDADGWLQTINYGGGARWFAKPHLAFSFDLRFYKFGAQDAITGRPAYPGARMLILSAGLSVK